MAEEQDDTESPDIVDEFDNTPEGEYKQAAAEENLQDQDFDYQQGFNYPEQQYKDSITKFYRHVISILKPKGVVRVANFKYREKKNALNCLDIAYYNRVWNCELIAKYFEDKAVNIASVSMGGNGFLLTNVMTQTRVVKRQTEKPAQPTGLWANRQPNPQPR